MDAQKKRRLAELREQFTVTEVNGHEPLHDVLAETIAEHLNKKHGREVLVRRKSAKVLRSVLSSVLAVAILVVSFLDVLEISDLIF